MNPALLKELKELRGARVYIDHQMKVGGSPMAVAFFKSDEKQVGANTELEVRQGIGIFVLKSDTVIPGEPARRVMALQTPGSDGSELRWNINIIDQDEDFLEGVLFELMIIEREVSRVH